MSRISILSNPDKLVETKANFFADWFNYFSSNIGKTMEFELENPLSVTDKIIFQLENNPEHCTPYLNEYFTHGSITDAGFLNEFITYGEVTTNIDLFNKMTSKARKAFLQNIPCQYIEAFKLFKEELEKRLFKLSLDTIIKYLKCPHDLDYHMHNMKFLTQVLVTEYLFSGKDRDDIAGAFTKILSSDINVFPFPRDIVGETLKKEYLNARSLDKQFEGLQNLLEQPGTRWTFFFRTAGVGFGGDFMFRYNEVTIFGKEHERFDGVKKRFPGFFSGMDNFFISSVSVSFYSYKLGLDEAIAKVRQELVYVSDILKCGLIVDSSGNFLVEADGKVDAAWSSENFGKKFNADIHERLTDNPFHFLAACKGNAVNHFLGLEHIITDASYRKSLSGFWHYIETLMQGWKKEGNLFEKLSTIILLDESELRKSVVVRKLLNTFNYFGLPGHMFGLGMEDLREIEKSLSSNIIPAAVRKIDYPFIKDIVSYYGQVVTVDGLKSAKAYYSRILREAYAHRNFYIHNARGNEKLNLKLTHTLPGMIVRFRWLLFDLLKNNTTLEFDDLIDTLYERAKLLLTDNPTVSLPVAVHK